ncbi:MAG: FHA domain-containing protein [Anaerolineae bacterium]|nr:FHA domain-containing protein [Anaerolineae bacterium]
MQECPNCGKENIDTDAYCYACGHILPSSLGGFVGETNRLQEVYEMLEPRRRWGTAYFDRQNQLQFQIRDTGEVMVLNVENEVVLGRGGDGAEDDLLIDLTPFDALEKGVSRRHLLIRRDADTIVVVDLGSANNTYLNGQRLIPHEPRILRDNDELRLGRLVLRVGFA